MTEPPELPVPDESLYELGRYAAAYSHGIENDEHRAVRAIAAPILARLQGPRPDPTPGDVASATEAFHVALQNEPTGRGLGHGREGDWVDDSATAVVEALLRAGWTPPLLP